MRIAECTNPNCAGTMEGEGVNIDLLNYNDDRYQWRDTEFSEDKFCDDTEYVIGAYKCTKCPIGSS